MPSRPTCLMPWRRRQVVRNPRDIHDVAQSAFRENHPSTSLVVHIGPTPRQIWTFPAHFWSMFVLSHQIWPSSGGQLSFEFRPIFWTEFLLPHLADIGSHSAEFNRNREIGQVRPIPGEIWPTLADFGPILVEPRVFLDDRARVGQFRAHFSGFRGDFGRPWPVSGQL